MKVKVLNFYQAKSNGTEFKPDHIWKGTPLLLLYPIRTFFLGHPDYFKYLSCFLIIQPGPGDRGAKKITEANVTWWTTIILCFIFIKDIFPFISIYILFFVFFTLRQKSKQGHSGKYYLLINKSTPHTVPVHPSSVLLFLIITIVVIVIIIVKPIMQFF